MKPTYHRWFWLMLAGFLLAACNFPGGATPTDPMAEVRTAAALTVQAMSTQAAPTQTAPALPTLTPPPAASASATPNPDLPCNLAEFVSESVPDGSQFFPGSVFVKSWTLRNAGSCVWTTAYQLEYVSGNIPDILSLQKLTNGAVAPGQTLVIMLSIMLPQEPGDYRADFRLRDADGTAFSFKNPEKTFWAAVEVVNTDINLAENLCAAEWTSGAGKMSCPGKSGTVDGFAYTDPKPPSKTARKTMNSRCGSARRTHKMDTFRAYPGSALPSGARFEAVLGCAKNAAACDAEFSLLAQAGLETPRLLAAWNETNDGAFHRISYDLSDLAGQNLRLILRMDSRGSALDDVLHLLMPVLRN